MESFDKIRQGLIASAAAGALVLGIGVGAANAASVSSQLFKNQLNQLSDNSGESMNIDVAPINGFLWVGDSLRGTADWQTVEDLSGGGGTNQLGTAGVNELTAIFEVVVTSATISFDLDGSCGVDVTCGGGTLLTGDEFATYTFGTSAAFNAEFGLTAGTLVAFYEDATPDYNRNLATQALIEATATDGPLVLELGFFGDADEGWTALGASTNPAGGSAVPQATILGTFNVQLSIGKNALFGDNIQVAAGCLTIVCGGDGLIDVNGSGGVTGTLGSTSFYDIFDNVDLVFIPVPEPGILGLMGVGLLSLAAIRRRYYSRKA